jgi:hypothetical protein
VKPLISNINFPVVSTLSWKMAQNLKRDLEMFPGYRQDTMHGSLETNLSSLWTGPERANTQNNRGMVASVLKITKGDVDE